VHERGDPSGGRIAYSQNVVPDLTIFEVVVLCLFVGWCAGVFAFLRFLSARAEKSAAEPEPGRQELDALIDDIEKKSDQGWPDRD
jgi:hypothetical protein